MRYIPPRSWPPQKDADLPSNDFGYPYGLEDWTPSYNRPPVPPTGEGFLISPAGGLTGSGEVLDDEARRSTVAARFVSMWAMTVMKTAHIYHRAALKAAWTDREIDRGDQWSPNEEDLRRSINDVWVAGFQLVNAAYQFKHWREEYEHDGVTHDEVEYLRALRNSLEHLNKADFSAYEAHAREGKGNQGAWSIRQLPEQVLFLGFHASYVELAFGVVDVKELVDAARPYLYADEPDPDEGYYEDW